MNVIWHDVECGAYVEDLELWRSLAERHGDPLLDVGAGTGRTALDLARRGHRVMALDRDPVLIAELRDRAEGLELEAVVADARSFEIGREFALILMPMQTIQLLGGPEGRAAFLHRALAHLRPGGALAVAISSQLEPYEVLDGGPAPLPDVLELDGVLYASQPVAVREDRDGFVLHRRRETVSAAGERSVEDNEIRLDRLTPDGLEREARAAGFSSASHSAVPATADHVGSEVVILGA